jgi:NTP pyrophosphatase (non-canonical NTP hydrolase)
MSRLKTQVLIDISSERARQDAKWGVQRHDMGTWLQILIEEVGEVAQAMQTGKGWGKESDASDLYTELIHVAAVAVAIAEQVKEERVIDEN